MKLIWLSVAPWSPSGYGIVTREIVRRIQAEGHEVVIATKHFHTGTVEWEGMKTISGMDTNILNRMVDKGEADYIISLLDNHAYSSNLKNWISYTPFDTHKIPASIAQTLDRPLLLLALTRHGQKEIEGLGHRAVYVPHGVDTSVFKPDAEKRWAAREKQGWGDNFIIGSVGVNYPDDRKNYVNLLRAFKVFHERHEEARLYLSVPIRDTEGDDYLPLALKNLGLDDLVKWGDPDQYYMGQVSDKMMANRYRMMDVFCLPTKGEGFGLPLIEAQACSVPVITTGASTGPELCPTQFLIPVQDHEWEWYNKEWRPSVTSQSILEVMEVAYRADLEAVGRAGRKEAEAYDWDYVFDTYWKPVLAEIEGLKTKVQHIPNYNKLYQAFVGRITMSDCGRWCENGCDSSPLLPREIESDRSILARSYPVSPDKNGRLWVTNHCPLQHWLSPKFKKEVRAAWGFLWGFPLIRQYFKDVVPDDESILLDDLTVSFNGDYKWAMQSQYRTNLPDLSEYLKGQVLEVGCGDGARVRALRDKGVDATGIEVNPAQCDGDVVQKGDAEALTASDNEYDVVYSADVLEHLENPLKALSEMFRVSRGMVINSVTPLEDLSFGGDPTHKVEWDKERWKREIHEFGEIVAVLEPFTIVSRKGNHVRS